MKWTSNTDPSCKDGWGQFEIDGPVIHFEQFSDYFYVQRLLDLTKDKHQHQGRKEVLSVIQNYVEGK